MKKSLLALAVLGSFVSVASAQASVTLWGIVDVSAKAVKNDGQGTMKSLATNGINSSRLGFRGTEDLGGGLKAGFWLEGSIYPDDGTGKSSGGLQFDRRSTVSLMGGFGELRLGRDYTPTFWNTTIFDPFGTNGVGSSLNLSNFKVQPNYVRASNSVGYLLPKMGGLYGQLMVAAGEGKIGHYVGGRVGYAGGPFNVALAVGQTDEHAGTDEFKVWNIAGSYDFGMAKVMAQYNKEEMGTNEENRALLGVSVPMGQGDLNASYVRVDQDVAGGGSGADGSQLALGYVYNLSKRTAVYGTVARLDNKDGASYAISGGPGSPDAGKNSTGFELGLRHSF